MPRLVKAACPNCGGAVSLDTTKDWVACTYCGTSSFIQRPASGHAPPPHGQYPVIQVPPQRFRLVYLLPFVVIFVLSIFGALTAHVVSRASSSATGTAGGATAAEKPAIDGNPMLGDANGDSVTDVIVVTRVFREGQPVHSLSAIDPASGATLWTSDALGKTAEISLAVADERVWMTKLATLSAFDIRTGKPAWNVSLPERVERYCRLEDGRPAIATKDHRFYAVDASNGRLSPAGQLQPYPNVEAKWYRERKPKPEGKPCIPLSSSLYGRGGPGVAVVSTNLFSEGPANMSVSDALTFGHRPPYLLMGRRQQGTRVPMVAAWADDRALWISDVPGTDPLRAEDDDPLSATLTARFAVLVYGMQEPKQVRMTAFELANGKRLWDVEVPARDEMWSPRVLADDRHVLLKLGPKLHVHALVDGRQLRTIP